MSNKIDRNMIQAFADGELDVEQNLQVMGEISDDRETAGQVRHQQQLRQAVGQSMVSDTPALPDALRSQIESILDEQPVASQPAPAATSEPEYQGPTVVGRVGFTNWIPAAVAAILLIAALPGYFAMTSGSNQPSNDHSAVAVGYSDIIPVRQTQQLARRHVNCSRKINQMLHADKFPQQLQKIPDVVIEFIGADKLPNLDLAAMGYEFDKMGECIIPGDHSVHLIYKATPESGKNDSISLWMRKYDGRPAIDNEQLYVLADADTPHPVIMWRQNETIYYVASDGLLGPALGVRESLLAAR